jgi:cephalosporin hydroxylase
LEAYFDAHTEGPGIWKWRHYFEIYHRHFSKFVGREVHVVEIGIFSGGSLEMWHHYFGDRCQIYGVDIEPACKAYASDSVRVFIGDQADPAFWARFREQVPVVDVVIDDGGHEPRQQVATLEALLPHMSAGAVYVCEDVHASANEFHGYVDGFSRLLHETAVDAEAFYNAEPTGYQRHVGSVHRYPFVVVIEKPEQPLRRFEAAHHGTEWQPRDDRFPKIDIRGAAG